MKVKVLIIAAFCAALLLLLGAVALETGGRSSILPPAAAPSPDLQNLHATAGEASSARSGTDSASSAAEATPNATSSENASPEAGATAKPSAKGAPDSTFHSSASPTRPTWDPADPSSAKELEIPETTKPSPTRLPKSAKRKPALSKEPRIGTARGKFTAGFPKRAVPAPENARIAKSSVQVQGKRIYVGLEGTTENGAEFVERFYADAYAAKEWAHTVSAGSGGARTLEGGFDQDSMVVTVRTLPTGRVVFVVAGVFTVGD